MTALNHRRALESLNKIASTPREKQVLVLYRKGPGNLYDDAISVLVTLVQSTADASGKHLFFLLETLLALPYKLPPEKRFKYAQNRNRRTGDDIVSVNNIIL